jgi:hypothetical protein
LSCGRSINGGTVVALATVSLDTFVATVEVEKKEGNEKNESDGVPIVAIWWRW